MSDTKEKRATFTQGPWTFTLADENSSGGVYGCEKCVCDIIPKELAVAWDCEEVSIANANARLIAAAPELYEQCKEFEKVLTYYHGTNENTAISTLANENRDKLREILAKVDGGEG
tara:strand:- start:341 stop:688 length:348 start_codon:yes stop_codon:yes gene_type:complete